MIGVDGTDKHGVSKFKVICKICSKDKELFPRGYFSCYKSYLLDDKKPCHCSKNPQWVEEQFIVLIKRVVRRKNLIFLGYSGKYLGAYTYLKLKCKIDGHTWNSTINTLINSQCGCPVCGKIKKALAKTLPEEDAVMRCNVFCEQRGYTFKGFVGTYKGLSKTRALYCCPLHGEQEISCANISRNNTSCPGCQKTGYNKSKTGSFYIVVWSSCEGDSFIKFGITNRKVSRRIKEQANKTNYIPNILFEITWEDGNIAYNLESIIKQSKVLSLKIIDKGLFEDGHNETIPERELSDLLNIVNLYLKQQKEN